MLIQLKRPRKSRNLTTTTSFLPQPTPEQTNRYINLSGLAHKEFLCDKCGLTLVAIRELLGREFSLSTVSQLLKEYRDLNPDQQWRFAELHAALKLFISQSEGES